MSTISTRGNNGQIFSYHEAVSPKNCPPSRAERRVAITGNEHTFLQRITLLTGSPSIRSKRRSTMSAPCSCASDARAGIRERGDDLHCNDLLLVCREKKIRSERYALDLQEIGALTDHTEKLMAYFTLFMPQCSCLRRYLFIPFYTIHL